MLAMIATYGRAVAAAALVPGVAQGGAQHGLRRCARQIRQVRMVATVPTPEAVEETAAPVVPSMDDLVSLCKRRGFIFLSSEIYGGFAGFYDFGPLGVELRSNIKAAWWRDFVHRRDDIVGLDSSIVSSPKVWKASGHVDGFSDPMVDCKESKLRYRADQLFWSRAEVDGELLAYVSLMECDDMLEVATAAAEKIKRKEKKQGTLTVTEPKDFTEATAEEQACIPSPATGTPTLTAPREFNLMFQLTFTRMSWQAASVVKGRPTGRLAMPTQLLRPRDRSQRMQSTAAHPHSAAALRIGRSSGAIRSTTSRTRAVLLRTTITCGATTLSTRRRPCSAS